MGNILEAIMNGGQWLDGLRRKKLPIDNRLNEIVSTVAENPVTIVEADTGAGKTVRIIQSLLLAMPTTKVWLTSLRRNAVRAIAKYIAFEMRCKVGGLIGYRLAARGGKAENFTSKNTRGEVLVDASVVSWVVKNGRLPKGVLVVDEAHERSLVIDFLLGIAKILLPKSSETKLVVTSATIDTKKFSEFFNNAPVISVEGRCFPVEVYEYPLGLMRSGEHHSEAVTNIALELVSLFVKNGELPAGPGGPMKEGTIIGLLPGKLDIENSVRALRAEVEYLECGDRVEVFGLGGWSSAEEDEAVQSPVRKGTIRFVFATEILRSQRTVPDTRIVIDSLRIKRVETNPVGGGRLQTVPVARAQADQAKGRAGRTAPGLYVPVSHKGREYDKLEMYPKPAVLNEPMTSVVLQLAKLVSGVEDFPAIREFPFIDSPASERIEIAISRLQKMGALDGEEKITELGELLLQFPIDPESAMALITADKLGVLAEAVIAAAIRECQGISFFPRANGDDGFWTVDKELLCWMLEEKGIEVDWKNLPEWVSPEGDFFKINLDSYRHNSGARAIANLLRKHFAGAEKNDFAGQVRMYRAYKAEEFRLKAVARKRNADRAHQLEMGIKLPKFNWKKELRKWCQGRCLKIKSLEMVEGTISQILDDVKRSPLTLRNGIAKERDFSSDDLTKALMSGRVDNIVIYDEYYGYRGGIGMVSLSYNAPCQKPAIALVGHPQKMKTRRGRVWYLVDEVAEIKQEWLEEILPNLFERRLAGEYIIGNSGEVLEKEEHFFLKTLVAENRVVPEPSTEALQFFISKMVVGESYDSDWDVICPEFRSQNFILRNKQMREESERLWIRSGGTFQRISDRDLVEFYLTKLPNWIRSVDEFNSALETGEIRECDLYIPEISIRERWKALSKNPGTVKIDSRNFLVEYAKYRYEEKFYAKVEVDREFAYSTKTESVTLPSGRRCRLVCDGKSADSFPELVEQLLKSDCSEVLEISREEPWHTGGFYGSLTELGQALKSQIEALVKEHAENPKADDMAGRIEALKSEALALRNELGGAHEIAKNLISKIESELLGLIAEIEDEELENIWREQISGGIERAREKLSACNYDAVEEICGKLSEEIESNLNSAKDAYTGFREIWCRRSGSNNGDGWVVRPDGSFREHDVIDNPRSRYPSEGYKSWHLVFPDELAISWKKGTRASEHEFKVYHLPAEGLTEAQIKTLKILLEELEAEWDGATGLASGNASPSVGEGWLNPETGESLTLGFQTSRQKREAEANKTNSEGFNNPFTVLASLKK